MITNANSSCSRTHGVDAVALCTALSVILVFARLSLAAAADGAISPSVAALFIGEEKTVEGPVTAAERDANVVRLHVGKAPQELIVSLVIGLLNTFPPVPENYYPGKTVRVAGTLRSFRGVPEIVIRNAADIQVVDSGVAGVPAAAAPAVSSGPAAPPARADDSVRQRLETLTERVRQLEERVRQLESSRTHL
jgi:hypothetical protein